MSESNFKGPFSSKTFIKYVLLCWVLQRSKYVAHVPSEFIVQEGKRHGMAVKPEILTHQ